MRATANEVSDDGPIRSASPAELAAYVRGELPAGRRAEVEGFLACNPDLAAQVMQALHQQQRAATARTAPVRRTALRTPALRSVAVGLACALLGWGVAEAVDDDGPFRDLSPTPEYVDEAVMSFRTALLRGRMRSQAESPAFDTAELRRELQLRVPVLPAGWRVTDAQVVPSDEGPGLSLLIETAPGHPLNLFVVRANTTASERPQLAERDGERSAYWEEDGAAYVLTGNGPQDELLMRAAELSRNAFL